MKRMLLIVSSLTAATLLGACHPSNQIVTTNTDDVVLNDAQANYAFRGDNEQAANGSMQADNMASPAQNDMAADNGMTGNASEAGNTQ